MSNIAIVYMTKYGHTKQYADWLKQDLNADVFSVGAFSPAQALAYKLVILLSGVYGDKIQIMDFIKKNQTAFNIQRMMIGAVGWYTNESEEGKTKLIADNFPENYKNVVPFFLLNSGIDKKKINAMEKAQLLAAQMAISKHDERSSDDINALAIIKGYSDQTSRDNLTPLKNAVEAYFKPKSEAAKPKAEPPKPAPAAESKPAAAPAELKPLNSAAAETKKDGGVVLTSPDDALATLNDSNAFAKNAAPAHYSASVEKPEDTKEEPAILTPVEETAPTPEKKPEPPKDDLLASLDSAFANLGGVKHEEPAPAPVEEKKPEPPKDDLLASLDNAFANLGGVKHEEPAPAPEKKPEPPKDDLLASLDNAFANLGGAKHEEPAPAPAPEKKPEPPKDDLLASLDNAFANLGGVKHEEPAPVEEKPVLTPIDDKPKAEVKLQPVDDPHILKGEPTQEEKDNQSALDSLEAAFANLKKPEPKPHEVKSLRVPPIHKAEPAKETAPAPAPAPTIVPKAAAPKKNSYLELFAKRTKTEEAMAAAERNAQQAEEPKTEPAPEPVKPEPIKPAAAEPVAFDPFFDEAISEPAQTPEPVQYTAPLPSEPVSSSIDDFDFDLMGNESSTASKSSKRVLTAVSDLAKAKAKAAEEAERAKESLNNDNDDDDEHEVSDNTYSIADNQLTPSVPEEAPAERSVFEREQPQEVSDGRHHENTAEAAEEITKALREVEKYISAPQSEPEYDNEPEAPETEEFGADDVIFDNDVDYEPDEEPEIEEVPSGGTFDFKKLQQEIEASIEVNKKIKEKERLRNTRELDRARKEEADAAPKKGIKQPIDPDIFFQRPGKDYYDSDTMPEIRFDRHKRGK